jgi:predicted nuclease of predicted toxin-antitoxin system
LRAAGFDAADMREVGLRGHSDDPIFGLAQQEQRIIVAADLDFAHALRFPPGTHAGLVVLRVPDEWTPRQRAERIVSAVVDMGGERLQGAITIVEPQRIRLLAPDIPRG